MTKEKSSFWKVFWPGFTAVIIGGIITVIVFVFILFSVLGSFFDFEDTPLKVENNTILHLKLDGKIAENSSNEFSLQSLNVQRVNGLPDILYGIKKARSDSRIKGIFIELGSIDCGISTANEIRDAVIDFKKSGKFVISYLSGEVVTQKEYYVSSAADKVYGFPGSVFQWTGLGGEVIFFKDLLDKFDIDIQVIRGKENDFKSAVEPFSLSKMSDSSKLQTTQYLNAIWSNMKSKIADDRKISKKRLDEIADSLLVRKMDDAKNFGFIDGLMYKDEVLKFMAKKVKKKNIKDLEFLSLEKYGKRFFYSQQENLLKNKPKIAVVSLEGEISKGGTGISSDKICSILRDVRFEKNIKSVVLRINSPGGSALASEEIWREVYLLNKEKEVVVSMGDVAASGGYYIATPSDRIFAESTTITGSIGVFGLIPYLGDFLKNQIGLTFDQVSTNKHSIMALGTKMTKEELEILSQEVDQIYNQFLKRVADGRKISIDSVQVLARGRVWSGDDALKIGLVDQIGGLSDAISYLAKKNKYSNSEIIYYPLVKESIIDKIENYIEDNKEDFDISEDQNVDSRIYQNFSEYLQYIYKLETLTGMQMRMPFEIKLN